MCQSGDFDKCQSLSHMWIGGHTYLCRRNSDPVKVKDRTPGHSLICYMLSQNPALVYDISGLATFHHCSKSLASLFQRKTSLSGFSQVSGKLILILIGITDYSPKYGSSKYKRASLFSVSEVDIDNLRVVNSREENVESAQLRQAPPWSLPGMDLPGMEHYVPQTGACDLATREPTYPIFHSSALTSSLTGTLPNITRNAIVNCAEMVTYDIIKEKLLDYHLLTGEALGSRQLPSHSREGT